jgi:transcriptional regulator with XRE-family HTH domain
MPRRRGLLSRLGKKFWSRHGHRLRVTRLTLRLSEQECAKAHGVTLATYRKWEAGGEQRGNDGTLRFARKFNISLDWLISGDAGITGLQ